MRCRPCSAEAALRFCGVPPSSGRSQADGIGRDAGGRATSSPGIVRVSPAALSWGTRHDTDLKARGRMDREQGYAAAASMMSRRGGLSPGKARIIGRRSTRSLISSRERSPAGRAILVRACRPSRYSRVPSDQGPTGSHDGFRAGRQPACSLPFEGSGDCVSRSGSGSACGGSRLSPSRPACRPPRRSRSAWPARVPAIEGMRRRHVSHRSAGAGR